MPCNWAPFNRLALSREKFSTFSIISYLMIIILFPPPIRLLASHSEHHLIFNFFLNSFSLPYVFFLFEACFHFIIYLKSYDSSIYLWRLFERPPLLSKPFTAPYLEVVFSMIYCKFAYYTYEFHSNFFFFNNEVYSENN